MKKLLLVLGLFAIVALIIGCGGTPPPIEEEPVAVVDTRT